MPTRRPKYVLTAACLTPSQLEGLAALSARTGITRSALVRAGVAAVLARPKLKPDEQKAEASTRRFFVLSTMLPPEQKEALAARAKRTGVRSMAFVRAGVDLVLADPTLVVAEVQP